MTNQDVLKIAMAQSAEDIGCRAEDFLSDQSAVVPFTPGANAKKYYKLPIACNLISYGNNVVQYPVGQKRPEVRFSPGMGGNDGETDRCCRRNKQPCLYCELGNHNALYVYRKIGFSEVSRETVAVKN